MARVFLSSAREDRPAMHRLAEALRRAGHEPSIDTESFGLDGTGLENNDVLLLGYSVAAERGQLQHNYLETFWTAATAGKRALVVRLDETPLPSELLGAYAFDLERDWWANDVPPLIAALAGSTTPFVGREPELSWLARHLGTGAPVAVIGEAGIGKTALVAEYARRFLGAHPEGRSRVRHEGQASGDRWEIVNPAGLADVIITARSRPEPFHDPVLELAPLPHEDARLLFECRAGPPGAPDEIQRRREIVAGTGGIPRALGSAARLHRRGWRVLDATAIARVLEAAAPPESPERSLVEGALPFAPRGVPIEWAARVGGIGSDSEAGAAARSLEPPGLVRIREPELHLHPAMAASLRRQPPAEAQRAMRARADELVARHLSSALATDQAVDASLLEHAAALAISPIDEAPSPWLVALQERLAELDRRRGARPISLQSLEWTGLLAAPLRVTHGDLYAIVEARRAELAAELGDLDRARGFLAEALAAAQRQPAGDGLRWRDVDPAAYQGALAAAVATAERLGDPGSAARAAFLLADSHGRQGGWERAAPIAEQALRAARQANEPILVALAYRLLADVALHGSRYEDARASFEEAIRRFDELGAEELAATSRLLYVTLLLQLDRRDATIRHAARLRDYLRRAPATWPYHDEATQALRLLDGSATATERDR